MSLQYTCDLCGRPIAANDRMVTIEAHGHGVDERGSGMYINQQLGHYHGEPQDSGPSCYRRMLDAITDQEEAARAWRASHEEWREARQAWRDVPTARRESLLFHVLGEEQLLPREIFQRLADLLGSEPRRPAVYKEDIVRLVRRLYAQGHLDRVFETFGPANARSRYRYFRRVELTGPIAELEQAYYDDRRTTREGGA
jgi:hypothetical protein